jgi:antitoxin VapB
MEATAKVFTNGNSQAVRLPKLFRLETSEVWISRNPQTGDIILRPKPSEAERQVQLRELLTLIDQNTDHSEFLPERSPEPPRDPFADTTTGTT